MSNDWLMTEEEKLHIRTLITETRSAMTAVDSQFGFFASLAEQFEKKSWLSFRQKTALKRIHARIRAKKPTWREPTSRVAHNLGTNTRAACGVQMTLGSLVHQGEAYLVPCKRCYSRWLEDADALRAFFDRLRKAVNVNEGTKNE